MEFSFRMPGLAEINRLVQQQGFAPAPTPVAPPPAPLPSVEPAPMPAPVAPLPNFSGLPDLSNIDLSGLPGLPQMPLPAPVAAPAPAPTPAPAPAPLPVADPYIKMTQADLREIGVTLPPMTVEPAPAPVPVTPPPLPPQPVPPPPPAPVPPPPPAPVPPPPPPPAPVVEPEPEPAFVPPAPVPPPPPAPVPPPPPPPAPVVEPAPVPVPVTPPPTPPTPVAPPPVIEPAPTPAPTPTPITPPPTPPTSRFDMLEPRFDIEPGFVPNLPRAPVEPPAPTAPPPVIEPAPTLEPEFSLPEEILNRLPPEERFESPPIIAQPNVPPEPVPTPTPEPAPSVGIETLAPEDFTMPTGIVAGPMSTPAVNNRVETAESSIPMPDGSQFNLDSMNFTGIPRNVLVDAGVQFDFEGIPMVDPVMLQNIQNSLVGAGVAPVAEPTPTITPNLDAGLTLGDTFLTEPRVDLSNERELAEIMRGGSANRGDVVAPTPEPPPTASSFQPEAGGFTLTPEQQAAIDAAIAQGEFGFAGDSFGFTDGQQDAAGVIPGAGAAANATTNASTNPNAGQDWYENMTDEQREAYDAWIAGGGLANFPGGTIDLSAIGGGTVNIPGLGGPIGGYTGTTPRPVVEAIQNLAVDRDPTRAGNVSVATQYGLTGAPPVQARYTNPFQRPETQQGIGSLAGGG